MRTVLLIGPALLSVALTASVAACIRDEPDPTPIEILRIVMEHRLSWMRDSTSFSACTIYERLGRPDNLAERLGGQGGLLLDRTEDYCASPRPEGPIVALISLTTGDSIAEVILRVQLGEVVHMEEFKLRPVPGQDWWAVHEVRLSDWGVFHR